MIRKFQKEDTGQVMRIWLNGNKDAHPFIPKEYWESNYSMVEEQILPVQLFNVTLSEEGQQRACAMVNQAEQVSFEIDDHVEQLYPLPVWLFCDGQLLQRVLVEEGVAQVNIRNPEYAYQAQLEAVLHAVKSLDANANTAVLSAWLTGSFMENRSGSVI